MDLNSLSRRGVGNDDILMKSLEITSDERIDTNGDLHDSLNLPTHNTIDSLIQVPTDPAHDNPRLNDVPEIQELSTPPDSTSQIHDNNNSPRRNTASRKQDSGEPLENFYTDKALEKIRASLATAKSYSDLPSIVRSHGNWKQLHITNINAALRAGRGCEAGASDFVWESPAEGINTSFDYTEEILDNWR